jgi:uncharacterized protein (DUF427 family)
LRELIPSLPKTLPRCHSTVRGLRNSWAPTSAFVCPSEAKTPGPDHQITIETTPERIVVSVAGRVVADTQNALKLHETNYQPVHYIPLDDVDLSLLEATDHATYCPYKGECSYYSVPAGGEKSVNAVWTYRTPYPAVAKIIDHVAFYLDRVDAIEERAPNSPEQANGVSDSEMTT